MLADQKAAVSAVADALKRMRIEADDAAARAGEELRGGLRRVMEELASERAAVADLKRALAEGGGPAGREATLAALRSEITAALREGSAKVKADARAVVADMLAAQRADAAAAGGGGSGAAGGASGSAVAAGAAAAAVRTEVEAALTAARREKDWADAALLTVALEASRLEAEAAAARAAAAPPGAREPPADFLCPITAEVMRDPVLLVESGNTYERAAIERWLAEHDSDPLTNARLRSKALAPNNALRSMIMEAYPPLAAAPSAPPLPALAPSAPPLPAPARPAPAAETVDVCFLMDATGSMAAYIGELKDRVVALADALQTQVVPGGCVALRLACVAYRDYEADGSEPTDAPRLEILPFTDDPAALRTFLANLRATGGADGPEDVAGALDAALDRVSGWRARHAVLIHIADAPGHGAALTPPGMRDNFPGGDPGGRDYRELLRRLQRLKIAYFFFSADEEDTAPMVKHFNSFFPRYQARRSCDSAFIQRAGHPLHWP